MLAQLVISTMPLGCETVGCHPGPDASREAQVEEGVVGRREGGVLTVAGHDAFLVRVGNTGCLRGGEQRGADPGPLRATSEHRRQRATVANAAGGNYRYAVRRCYDQRQAGERAQLTRVPAGF